jgi:hypothetical protein
MTHEEAWERLRALAEQEKALCAEKEELYRQKMEHITAIEGINRELRKLQKRLYEIGFEDRLGDLYKEIVGPAPLAPLDLATEHLITNKDSTWVRGQE